MEWLEQADYPNGTHKGSIWFPDKTGSGYSSVDSSSYPERVSTYSSSSEIRKDVEHMLCPYGYGEDSSGSVQCKDKPIDVHIVP